jgi:hypothetical protein
MRRTDGRQSQRLPPFYSSFTLAPSDENHAAATGNRYRRSSRSTTLDWRRGTTPMAILAEKALSRPAPPVRWSWNRDRIGVRRWPRVASFSESSNSSDAFSADAP